MPTQTNTKHQSVSYPDIAIPRAGQVVPVGCGVFWLRMPLPFKLNHINLYLLEDVDGWYIIDTGLGGNKTTQLWQQIFNNHLNNKPVKGIIVTHLHPDHVGQAGFLCEHWQVPLQMTRDEYFLSRVLTATTSPDSCWTTRQYHQRSGLPEENLEQLLKFEQGFGNVVETIPRSYQRLTGDSSLLINNEHWRVMIGRGHSPEHACLYNETQQILISGDQLLPAITPNISVHATEPDDDPLQEYLSTLPQFSGLPQQTLVLPAHNRPFHGLQARIAGMQSHHNEKLKNLLAACANAQTAYQLLPALFTRKLSDQDLMFALGECLAHLNHLLYRGQLNRTLSDNGHYLYQQTGA